MSFNFDLGAFLRDPQFEALVRVVLAGVVCALVGLEREFEGKPAGVRTYGLIGMGAAAFTAAGLLLFPADAGSRVAQGIITGVGFLGAGVILHMERRVYGLTTAAGTWVAAAVWLAIGGGLYILGVGSAIALFVLLQLVGPERRLRARRTAAHDHASKADHPDATDSA